MVALLPYIGVLDIEDVKRTNMLPVLFVGAALSMGIVLRETGALSLLTSTLVKGVQPLLLNEAWAVSVLYWGAFVYHLFIPSEVSMIATSMPTIIELAHTHGFNPLWIGLLWTFAAGGKIFVYQSGVLVVGYSYGYFNHVDMIKIGVSLTLAEFAGVVLTEMFWWPMIGITP
jgi:di/tricarboxylate transporter